MSKLVVHRNQFPGFKPAVGDEVEVVVRGLVTRVESDVIEMTSFNAEGLSDYLPGEIETEVLLVNVVDARA